MEAAGVYQTPSGDLTPDNEGYADLKIFSFNGRIGRLRYLAYAFGVPILMFVLIGIVAAIAASISETFVGVVAALGGISVLVVGVSFGLRRLHDLDKSAWWLLLFIVPLANIILGLYMLFARGVDGSNQYGLQPPANSTGVKVTVALCALYFFGSIIVAITMPALLEMPAG